MSTLRFVAAVTSLSLAAMQGSAFADTAYQSFPLDGVNTGSSADNVWVFVEDNVGYLVEPTQVNVVKVTDSASYGFGWYGHDLAGLFGAEAIGLYDNTYFSEMWAHDGNSFSAALDYSADVGDSWSFRANACQAYDVALLTKTANVTAPAGEFPASWSFDFTQTPDPNVRCDGQALTHLLTAPGVGPIGYVNQTHKGHLLWARVGNNVVTSSPGETRVDPDNDNLEYNLAVTQESIKSTPIMCITTPCIPVPGVLQFALTITNTGTAPETLNFASGQKFDVDLFDSEGYAGSWSDGRAFTQATTSITIEPGQTEVFYSTMPFADQGGNPLWGEVQVVGYITTSSPKLSTTILGE